ncbi:nitroreductase family protein [Aquihabitans sp. McL0605]|uniref:nitroreductase family protein n=1 Tax=Aquihabitans sp. McL0605 TaxID=3415671 RepID=UPI003CF3D33C
MELNEAVHGRRMVRAFTGAPVDRAVLDRLCDLARRAPSAGHSQGIDLVVLEGPEAVGRYWDVTLPQPRRAGFRWPGLVVAPSLVLVVVDPGAYVARYAEPDKAATGLGSGPGAWPVPYWWVDAGAAVEHLLLGAVDEELGACLFGLFGHEEAVAVAFGIPADRRIAGAIAIGHPAPDEPGRSASRPRRSLDEVVHRGRW